MTKHYCAGVLFNPEMTRCVLIRKTKPLWQAGFLNAIGGSREEGESYAEAMEREFLEEAGVRVENWDPVLRLQNPAGDAQIQFFKAVQPLAVLQSCRTASEEGQVDSWPLSYLLDFRTDPRVIPNLRWILPVMLAHGLEPIYVTEATRGGFPT